LVLEKGSSPLRQHNGYSREEGVEELRGFEEAEQGEQETERGKIAKSPL
jgi:hypothetical protein